MTFSLESHPEGLTLIHSDKPDFTYRVDFNTPQFRYRLAHQHSEALAKAIGRSKYTHQPIVIDATAGFGRDSFILAHLGCRVIAIEQSEVLAQLVQDALIRAAQDPALGATAHQVTLLQGHAEDQLPKIAETQSIDMIYLDPMFPSKQKSALVKKDMQILQSLVGETPPESALLSLAMRYAAKIIVKRPRHAPPLENRTPTWQYLGKSARFDIYQGPFSHLDTGKKS